MGMSVQRHAPASLPPEKRPSTNCVGEDPRAGLHGCPPPGFNPRSVQPAASRYANDAIPARRSSCQHFYISFLHFQRLSFLLRVCEILTPIGPRLVVKPQDAASTMSRAHPCTSTYIPVHCSMIIIHCSSCYSKLHGLSFRTDVVEQQINE